MIPFQHPSQAARTTPCHPCGTVQICDLGNSSHAKAARESKPKAQLERLQLTADRVRTGKDLF